MKFIFAHIRKKITNNRLLIINFGHLSLFQFFNFLIPLFTYPYLIEVLGGEKYGLLIFAQTIIAYLSILVNFGFNLSATKEIAIHRNNTSKVVEIVSSVYIIKGLLLLLSFTLLFFFIRINSQPELYSIILLLSMHACIFDFLSPVWYFQGIEKMKYVTLINIVSKFIFTISIFVFIQKDDDYLLVPVIQGFGSLAAGFFSLYLLFVKFRIKFMWQKLDILKYHIRESYGLFISNISIQIYTNSNKLIVGSFLGYSDVAAYDLAEKLVNLAKTPLTLISQTIFPKISKQLNLKFIWKMAGAVLIINLVLFVLIFTTSPSIIGVMGGGFSSNSVLALRLLALTIPIVGISSFLGIQILIPFGYNRYFSRVIVISSFVYLFLFLVFYSMGILNVKSITTMCVITELYVVIHMFLVCKQKNLLWRSSTI